MRCVVLFAFALIHFSNTIPAFTNEHIDMVVNPDGSGDYQTIQDAINNVPVDNRERHTILIKNGTYNEKVFIEKDCITLLGEDKNKTKISYAILRDNWRKNHPNDWGASVINLRASDFVMKNLTVHNTYGDQHDDHSHQFAVRLLKGTRIVLDNCKMVAGGGDTVSLWDKEKGMYYHNNCYFEGYVDFVCPRGWCYIANSEFYECKKTAAIWLDGSNNEDKKFVIRNSFFDGIEGFKLGRRHYDAQFYLLNCMFSKNMADKPIYRKTYPENPARDAPNLWGDRYYFYNCHREDGDYPWHQTNLSSTKENLKPNDITAAWTFGNRWDPESTKSPEVTDVSIHGYTALISFSEDITVKGKPVLKMKSGLTGTYISGSGSRTIIFRFPDTLAENESIDNLDLNGGKTFASAASLTTREVNLTSDN